MPVVTRQRAEMTLANLVARVRAGGSVVLVGASKDPSKYGNKILKNLTSKGIPVVPINPREKEIEGRLSQCAC